ncbi:hypothetical protein SCLCIDRAFT_1186067 [Scleroderma citrinum Foug A]|uniref:MYND-type domain-containing protein n=1 Tax=Scleroderma citrinum Foug A TaxID=1036808 RepID=A0A0C3DU64_9AGAM|nr:hypothetical protein SCLCIDRAFT_1186067 [Scleroderma citrinum Foug A]
MIAMEVHHGSCVSSGSKVTAAARKCEKRIGERAPYKEMRCEDCKARSSGLKMWRFRVVRYCSIECQRGSLQLFALPTIPFQLMLPFADSNWIVEDTRTPDRHIKAHVQPRLYVDIL